MKGNKKIKKLGSFRVVRVTQYVPSLGERVLITAHLARMYRFYLVCLCVCLGAKN